LVEVEAICAILEHSKYDKTSVPHGDRPKHKVAEARERATIRTAIGDMSERDACVTRRYIGSLRKEANDVVNTDKQSYSTYHASPAGKKSQKYCVST
jgi:hypothetical protein